MKRFLIGILTVLVFNLVLAQDYANKDYYLVDSLDLFDLSKNDSIEIENSLSTYYKNLDDSIKIMAVRRLVKLCHDEQVWNKYNNWLLDLADSEYGDFKISDNLKNSTLAFVYNNKAYSERGKGNINLALEYCFKSLKLQTESNDKQGQVNSYHNIASIYKSQGDTKLALENYFKVLEINKDYVTHKNENIKDGRYNYRLEGIARVYNGIGAIYFKYDSLNLSKKYLSAALKLEEEVYDKKGIAFTSGMLGDVYLKTEDYDKAYKKINISIEMSEVINYKKGLVKGNKSLGDLYLAIGNDSKAEEKYLTSFRIASELGHPSLIRTATEPLYLFYEKNNDKAKAFDMYQLYIKMKDSVYNKETQRKVLNQQFQFNYEKQKAIDDAVFHKELALKQKEKENQRLLTLIFVGLALVILIISLIIFNRLKVVNKKNVVIENQKRIVKKAHIELEEKNKEVIDSIVYAKRIQSAILPNENKIKEVLGNSFVLYKPKDIVAGDFYWVDVQNEITFFAVADCTGHGVPGAMVSVVCNSGLNRSVREYNFVKPSEILNKTRELVIDEFNRSDEEVKDGMDIALCSIRENELSYSGAYNPLWIIRNKSKEVEEIKADKQPIGVYSRSTEFVNHSTVLNEGDLVYLFSDGFADQFGGEKEKKFKTVNFKKLLLSISSYSLEKQKEELNLAFDNWKGNLEQLDDVCILGYKHKKV